MLPANIRVFVSNLTILFKITHQFIIIYSSVTLKQGVGECNGYTVAFYELLNTLFSARQC